MTVLESSQEAMSGTPGPRWSMPKLWEGQALHTEEVMLLESSSRNDCWFSRHRRLIAFVSPGLLSYIIWWSYAATHPSIFKLFTDVTGEAETPNWYMCITMAFGSMFAGATSEGGASVAFPVMTLAFGISPQVARDFSFMIQSAGMTAAAVTIFLMKVHIETHAIVYATIGGVCGLVVGLEQVAPLLGPSYAKMIFVCTWAAFAFSLYCLNRLHNRRVFARIPDWSDGVLGKVSIPLPGMTNSLTLAVNWKACALFSGGFVGGVFGSISGSGVDVCTFSVLTLLFRVSEKTATPTSVVLMAINTVVGFAIRQLFAGGVAPDAIPFFIACVPVVVIGAPLGSLLGSHLHRLVLASLIYLADIIQLISALVIVKPWSLENTNTPVELCILSATILVLGCVLFATLAKSGEKLLNRIEDREQLPHVGKALNGLEPAHGGNNYHQYGTHS